jgi:hypothetical protein
VLREAESASSLADFNPFFVRVHIPTISAGEHLINVVKFQSLLPQGTYSNEGCPGRENKRELEFQSLLRQGSHSNVKLEDFDELIRPSFNPFFPPWRMFRVRAQL